MKPYEIKSELMARNIRQRAIARECGVGDSCVSMVIRHSDIAISRPVAEAIARKIELPIELVFTCYARQKAA